MDYIKMMYDFHDSCYEKHLFRHINSLVNTAKESYKDDLENKRNRLRELMEFEEHQYETEYREMVQSKLENTIRQRQDSLLKIRSEKLLANKEFIKQKRAEQIMNNSDEIRTTLSQNFLNETKRCQLAQIEEAKQKRLAEQEVECMWYKAQNHLAEQGAKRQEQENHFRKTIALNTQQFQRQQYAEERKPIDWSSDYYAGFGSLFRDENNGEEEKKKRLAKLRKENQQANIKGAELKRQIQEEQLCTEQRFINAVNQQIQVEQEKLNKLKEFNRTESDIYLKYLEDTKRYMTQLKNDEMQAVETQQNQAQCKVLTKYNDWKAKRKNNARKSHSVLLGQIHSHEERQLQETIMNNEQHLAEIQIWDRENQLLENKKLEKQRLVEKYRAELLQQAADCRERKCTERQIEIDNNRKVKDYGDYVDQLAKSLSKEEDKYLMNHPNWELLPCGCKNPP